MKSASMKVSVIQNKIYEVRGQKVMIDFDIAELYDVETRVVNQAVKRNAQRFPKDFMFQLNKKEWDNMRSQIVIASAKRNVRALPYVFTEHGVTMLASVLKSTKAVKMNIAIVRAFISVKEIAIRYKDLIKKIEGLEKTVDGHGIQLNEIYDAVENLLDAKVEEKKWEDRERIGFRQSKKTS